MPHLKKSFVSDIDMMLKEFDKTHQTSKSQQQEIDKYQMVHQLRDNIANTAKYKSF